MNIKEKTKLRIANFLTAIVTIMTIVQTSITSPPLTPETIAIATSFLTYAILVATKFKQYLSPEVNKTGEQVTMWIAILATLTGLLDFIQVVHFGPVLSQYIKLGVSIAVMSINILSKTLFPSNYQDNKMAELNYRK